MMEDVLLKSYLEAAGTNKYDRERRAGLCREANG